MIDMSFNCVPYTWSNNQMTARHIKERLEKLVCNMSFRETHPNAQVFHLNAIGSDHTPLLCYSDYKDTRTPRIFRFEMV